MNGLGLLFYRKFIYFFLTIHLFHFVCAVYGSMNLGPFIGAGTVSSIATARQLIEKNQRGVWDSLSCERAGPRAPGGTCP